MKVAGFLAKILTFCTRLRWQLLISAVCAVASYVCMRNIAPDTAAADLHKPGTYLAIMGVVGGMLALASSVSYAHLTVFVGEAIRRRTDAYNRFRDRLYAFDSFLATKPSHLPLVHEARSFSWDLKKLRLQDVPITDWAERLSEVMRELSNYAGEGDLQNLDLEVMEYLGDLESCLSTIGIASIKQVGATVVAAPVMRSFGLLAVMLVSGIAVFFLSAFPILADLIAVIPVFFTIMAAMLFVHVAWFIRRELDEMLDFVDDSDDDKAPGQ